MMDVVPEKPVSVLPLEPIPKLVPSEWRAFTLACYNVMPSGDLLGRFRSVPRAERLCNCNSGEVESLTHITVCSTVPGTKS